MDRNLLRIAAFAALTGPAVALAGCSGSSSNGAGTGGAGDASMSDSPTEDAGGTTSPDSGTAAAGDASAPPVTGPVSPDSGTADGGVASPSDGGTGDAGDASSTGSQTGGDAGDAGSDSGMTNAAADGGPAACLPTGSMMTARLGWGSGAVTLNDGKVLIVGGVDTATGHVLASSELYDPTTGTFSSTGSMSTPRVRHALVTLGNQKVLAVGGVDDTSTVLSSAEVYDPASGTWSVTGRMSVARTSLGAVTLADGHALVFGGGNQSSLASFDKNTGVQNSYAGNGLASAEIYNPTTGTFALTGSMTVIRGFVAPYCGSLLLDGNVLVVGGAATADVYHAMAADGGADGGPDGGAAAGTFVSVGAPPSGVAGNNLVVTLNGGKALVLSLLGITASNLTTAGTAALFDPSSNTFSTAPKDPVAASAGILLPNGDVFTAGGEASGSPSAQTSVYRAASATWQLSEIMGVVRHAPALANLPNGKVLVMGGCHTTACGNSVLATAEICTP